MEVLVRRILNNAWRERSFAKFLSVIGRIGRAFVDRASSAAPSQVVSMEET
jgi:hypothetical protein